VGDGVDELGGCCDTDGKVGSTGAELSTITSGGLVVSAVGATGAALGSSVFADDRVVGAADFAARAAEDSAAW
jgi:hypothetical protein